MADLQGKKIAVDTMTYSQKEIALVNAASDGKNDILSDIIKQNIDVNCDDGRALIYAAYNGHSDTVSILLKANANPNTAANRRFPSKMKIYTEETALSIAARKGHSNTVSLLIKAGANVDTVDRDREWSALMFAAHEGHYDIVSMLVNANANINAYGNTALVLAAMNGHSKVVSILIDGNANIDATVEYGDTALIRAVRKHEIEIVSLLISANANVDAVNDYGTTALMCGVGCSEIVSVLLNAKAKINVVDKNGMTALMWAAWHGNDDIVSLLMKEHANINAANNDGETPLYIAAERGHSKVVSVLVKANVDINAVTNNGNTALITAARHGYEEVVKILLKANAFINATNNDGNTALIEAAMYGNKYDLAYRSHLGETGNGYKEIVSMLLKANANTDAVNKDGKTALICSLCRCRDLEVCSMLIGAGANTDIVDNDGSTALHYAVTTKECNETLSTLFAASENINAVDKRGNTILHIAALSCKRRDEHDFLTVSIVIKANIDVAIVNNKGDTALFVAVKNHNCFLIPMLIKAQANIKFDPVDEYKNSTSVALEQLLRIVLKATGGHISPKKRLWQDFLSLILYYNYNNDEELVALFLKHIPSDQPCDELWKHLCCRKSILDWLPLLPTRSYFKLAIEKGICQLICTFEPKIVLSPDFWEQDGDLMQGILYDLPDTMWSNKDQLTHLEETNEGQKGLNSVNAWDLNPRLNYAYKWDRSKAKGLISEPTHYRTLNLLDTNDKVAVRELNILKEKLSKLHGYKYFDIVEATLVCNDILTENFGRANNVLKHRHQDLPYLFKKQDWKNDIHKDYKQSVYKKYNAIISQNTDKSLEEVPVILMVHGTSEKAAYSIVKGGFGTVSALDAGYYGQGIYFTRSMQYACSYDTSGKDEKTLILTLVTPGNVYPVSVNNNLRGMPIKPGYQSHYVLVDRLGRTLKEDKLKTAVYDELVVAQDVQATPRYIIKVMRKEKNSNKRIAKEETNKEPSKSGGDNISDDELSDDDNVISSRKLWGSHLDSSDKQPTLDVDIEKEVCKKDENLKQTNERLKTAFAKQQQCITNLEKSNDAIKERLITLLDRLARLECDEK